MIHHHWLPAAGVVLALAALPAAMLNLRPQASVVDLRREVRPLPPLSALPSGALADPACRFIALRRVLDDLHVRANYLRQEAVFLERDANSLWSAWKGVFGVQHAFMRSNIGGGIVATGALEQRHQTRLFSLYSAGSRISDSAQTLSEKLRRLEERCLTISRYLETSNNENARRRTNEIEEIQAKLSKLADEVNALDDNVRQGQDSLDQLYTRVVDLVQQAAPYTIALPEPWHWTYMVSGRQRPALHYDFELRYDEELERARRDIARRASGLRRQ